MPALSPANTPSRKKPKDAKGGRKNRTVSLLGSQRACKEMTRHHAKSFYFASHVLPAQKRSDAYAVYAFCRYVDDQIDLAPDETARLRALADLSHLLHAAYL